MTVHRRRRFKQSDTLEHRLADEAIRLREEAKLLPPGVAREEVLRKARQYEAGQQMTEWLRAPDPLPQS